MEEAEGSEERTPAGDPVYRHKAVERPAEIRLLRSAFADKVEAHMEEHLGPAPNVLHEIVSDRIHLDVHVAPPHGERDFYVLYTTGMSTRPMTVPEGAEPFRYAEMMIGLPADWPGLDDVLRDTSDPGHPWHDSANYWPIRMLKSVARMPHDYSTWLGWGHTISAGDEDEPFDASTRLSTAMVTYPVGMLAPEAAMVKGDEEVEIFLYAIMPLYPEEREFKLKQGADALMELFEEQKVRVVIDPGRKSVVRRKRWGLF